MASLEKDPVAGAEAALTAGLFNEEDGDFTAAQASYRLAIQKGDLPYAKNNLAMLLGHHGGSLSEAVDLAHRCIAANSSGPDAATYYDTLAFLLDKPKQYDQAADAMQTALHMQPSNSRWHVNLARMFFEAGHRDKAQQTLQELEVMTPGVRGLPQEYRDQMDALKRQITAANIAAATQPHSSNREIPDTPRSSTFAQSRQAGPLNVNDSTAAKNRRRAGQTSSIATAGRRKCWSRFCTCFRGRIFQPV